jgi:hypothetical protein
MTYRACARTCSDSLPEGPGITYSNPLVSGVEAANRRNLMGNQVNAITSNDTNIVDRLRQQFLVRQHRFRFATQGWPQGATKWDGSRRPVDATRVARKS